MKPEQEPTIVPFQGMRVVQSPLAIKVEHRIEKWPGQKRRKRWTVRKHLVPCAYQLFDGTLVVHPTIYQQLRTLETKP